MERSGKKRGAAKVVVAVLVAAVPSILSSVCISLLCGEGDSRLSPHPVQPRFVIPSATPKLSGLEGGEVARRRGHDMSDDRDPGRVHAHMHENCPRRDAVSRIWYSLHLRQRFA